MTTTHDTQTDIQDRAILVSLVTDKIKRTGIDPELSLQELVQLAETAGVEVLDVLRQNKETPDSKWFIGKGKVEELRMAADGFGANTAIFDQELSGAQVRNLEEALDLKIIDRTQLILDIFAGRAKTREGIIQVELAQPPICCRASPGRVKTCPDSAAVSAQEDQGKQAGDGPPAHPQPD